MIGIAHMTHVILQRVFLFLLWASAWEACVSRPPISLGADDEARASYEAMGVQLRTVQQGIETGVWLAIKFLMPAMT